MRRIALCAALLCAPAFAQTMIARQGNDSVRLTEQPCTNEGVLARLEAGSKEQFRAASAIFQGKRYSACWRMMGNAAFLMYEDGDQGLIPAHELKPELSI